ncbi:DUF4212 domain-containing protein [Xylophilus rhododendri]|uniref:DUF4212 domain-containing protein n=1 Tax=Xylophilus rhododendri TaxID=2697032 RepID=A0A857JBK7_9BURK|nr:sodium/substrate symporter small subunit [Xylophilus rhododendri]QHJ00552.1 DUF4212 domain-containing protein [Xylophilus rhododendri]
MTISVTESPSEAGPVRIHRLGGLRILLLAVWAAAAFGTCWFARALPGDGQGGQPLAYALAGQGLLIVFIVLVVLNAIVFNRRDARAQQAGAGAGPGA